MTAFYEQPDLFDQTGTADVAQLPLFIEVAELIPAQSSVPIVEHLDKQTAYDLNSNVVMHSEDLRVARNSRIWEKAAVTDEGLAAQLLQAASWQVGTPVPNLEVAKKITKAGEAYAAKQLAGLHTPSIARIEKAKPVEQAEKTVIQPKSVAEIIESTPAPIAPTAPTSSDRFKASVEARVVNGKLKLGELKMKDDSANVASWASAAFDPTNRRKLAAAGMLGIFGLTIATQGGSVQPPKLSHKAHVRVHEAQGLGAAAAHVEHQDSDISSTQQAVSHLDALSNQIQFTAQRQHLPSRAEHPDARIIDEMSTVLAKNVQDKQMSAFVRSSSQLARTMVEYPNAVSDNQAKVLAQAAAPEHAAQHAKIVDRLKHGMRTLGSDLPEQKINAIAGVMATATQVASPHMAHEMSQAPESTATSTSGNAGTATQSTPETETGPYHLTAAQQQTIEGLSLTEAQKHFLSNAVEGAMTAVQNGAKINPIDAVSQAIIESGWGGSGLAAQHNNLFGVKAGTDWKGATVTMPTTEYENGKPYVVQATFRAYPDMASSFQDYAAFIDSKPWFADATARDHNAHGYLMGLENQLDANGNVTIAEGQPGAYSYATDPDYVSKVMAVAQTAGLEQILPDYVGGHHNTAPTATAPEQSASGQAAASNAANLAVNLAWKTRDHGPYVGEAKPAYQRAEKQYNGSTGENQDSDCGVFVATVMRGSQADPDYPVRDTAVQLNYLQNSDKYMSFDSMNDIPGGLKPGDIFIFNADGEGHTYMYVGEQTDGYNSVSASLNDHVPEALDAYASQSGHNFTVFRLK